MPERDFDAVVIGAGLGGLVCADTLAARGKRVALIEQHYLPGGYGSSFERDGYTFDTVVDSIGGFDDRGVLGPIFRRLDLLDRIDRVRLNPVRENLFGERAILIPAELEGYRENLCSHFPESRGTITAFLDLLTRLFREIRSLSMREAYGEGVSPELTGLRDLTWHEFATQHVPEPVSDVLAERCCFLGLPPSKVSAFSMIAMLMNYFDGGAHRIRGGYQSLSNLLLEDLRARGADVRMSRSVERVLVRDGAAVGVRLHGGEELSAGDVVSNGDVRGVLQELHGPDVVMKNLRPSSSFVVIHLGLSGGVQELFRASSIGYYPGGKVERAYGSGPESFIGFGLPTLDDPSLAPAGKHVMSIHVPVAAGFARDESRALAETTLNRLEKVVPGLRDMIALRSVATPQTLEKYTWNRGGTAYGWEHTPGRWRAVAELQELFPNHLFQAGHWSDYGGGTVSAMISGHEVAKKILRGWVHQAREKSHVG